MNTSAFEIKWEKTAVRFGMATVLSACAASFLPAVYLCISQGVMPPIDQILKAWSMAAVSYGAFYFVEPISYFSILGLSGTYLSFLSGNIGNMRVPCAAMALEVTGEEPGTKRGEIVSTLGITGSIITNLIFVTLAAFVGAAILALMPETVATAFKTYIAPAIYGAVFGQWAMKYPKVAVFGIGIPCLIKLLAPGCPTFVCILASVFGTILVGRFFFLQEIKKEKAAEA